MIATCLEGGLLHQGQCVARCPVGFYSNTVASCSRKESLSLPCFTSIKYLPYISLNAIPLLLPIKKTPRMAPPYIDWRDIRMTIVSIVSVTSCQISFLFIAEQRTAKKFKSFVIYKDLCYNFFCFFCDKAPKHLIFLVYHLFWYNFAFDRYFGD